LLAITGIEADYDGEQVSFDAAVLALREASIRAIIYTSPSHDEDAPRWRVLCPLSAEYPPSDRNRLMARLNGIFGGAFSRESWTWSQSYYFGAVNKNPAHRVAVTAGICLDQANRLDSCAIGKLEMPKPMAPGQRYVTARSEKIPDVRIRGLVTALLEKVNSAPDGAKHHTLLTIARTIGGYLHLIGWSVADAIEQLMGALPASVKDWDAARKTAAWGIAAGRAAPLELEDRRGPT
jgi:hypothetical protein